MHEALIILLSIIVVYCKIGNSSPIVHIIITIILLRMSFVAAILIIVNTVYLNLFILSVFV